VRLAAVGLNMGYSGGQTIRHTLRACSAGSAAAAAHAIIISRALPSELQTHCRLPAGEDGEEEAGWDDEDLLEVAQGGELGPRVSADLARTIRSGGAADDAELQELMTALQVCAGCQPCLACVCVCGRGGGGAVSAAGVLAASCTLPVCWV
jgi:hypothetical protein